MKAVVDAAELFPSEMLDAMLEPYLAGGSSEDAWLVSDAGDVEAVAYYAPERMTQGTWNLLLIAVRPDSQGRGVGRAMMAHVERSLRDRGARLLIVETSGLPEFAATRAFYERIGYDPEARIREFYRAGEDKVVFRKILADRRAPGIAG